MSEIEWSKSSVIKLIQLYQSHTFLWDSAHAEFRERRKRGEAWRSIAAGLRQIMVTPGEAEKKIHALRSQFRREQRRIHTYRSLNKAYLPKWYGYRYLLFTMKSLQLRCDVKKSNESTNKRQNIGSTSHGTQGSVANCRTDRTTQIINKPSENNEEMTQNYIMPVRESDEFSLNDRSLVTSHRDEFSTYGEYVANELRKISSENARSHMKHAINTILFRGLVGKYDTEHHMLHDSKFEDD